MNVSTATIDTGVSQDLRLLGRFVEADCCYLCQLSEDGQRLKRTHEWCRAEAERQAESFREVSLHTLPWLMQRLIQQECVLVTNVANLPPKAQREQAFGQSQGVESSEWVALRVDTRLIGLIGLDASRPEIKWDLDIASLLRTVSDCFTNLIARCAPVKHNRGH